MTKKTIMPFVHDLTTKVQSCIDFNRRFPVGRSLRLIDRYGGKRILTVSQPAEYDERNCYLKGFFKEIEGPLSLTNLAYELPGCENPICGQETPIIVSAHSPADLINACIEQKLPISPKVVELYNQSF